MIMIEMCSSHLNDDKRCLSDWDNATRFLSITKKEKKLTQLYSSGISYIYAMFLQMKREDLEAANEPPDPELDMELRKNLK